MAYTTIDDPSAHFQAALYNGSSSSVTVTNDGNSDLQPDWLWIKSRNSTHNHDTFDSSRGMTSKRLFPNLTNAEDSNGVASVTSDGFTTGTSLQNINTNGENYVAWQWKANGGTTSATVAEDEYAQYGPANVRQTNTTAGFSIITYTGTGQAGQIQHGLGAVPELIICKQRSNAENWAVYHGSNTSAPETDYLLLNTNAATADNSNRWNDEAPNTNVFTVGSANEVNTDARTYVAYVFTSIQGYSKFGSYTGNGNADGPFVYTGFKPAFFIVKRTDASGENFVLRDNAVSPINPVNAYLVSNDNRAEANHYAVDLLSNGFKVRTSESGHNHDGGTYIYGAFAESPFVSSEGVPTTAR